MLNALPSLLKVVDSM